MFVGILSAEVNSSLFHENVDDDDVQSLEPLSKPSEEFEEPSSPTKSVTTMELFEDPREDPLATFLMQVFITLVLSRILAKILSFIRQPQVIGQILTGIILGPSVFGYIPGFNRSIFPEHSVVTFQMVANLGLLFFMFFLGLKLDPQEIKEGWRRTLPVACASIIVPVGIGCAASLWLYEMNGPTVKASFILFIGSGIGFSAFPVLASLLQANNMITLPIGILTISVAAIEDIVVWVVLAIASAFSDGGSMLQGLYTLLLTLGYVLIMIFSVKPLLGLLHKFYVKKNDEFNIYLVVVCLMLLIVSAFTTQVINIHAFFGSFICGLIIPRSGTLHEFLALRIELFIVEFFLPLYFANSGRKTELYLLNTISAWYTLLVLVILASLAKIIPVSLMTKLVSKQSWSYSVSVGILMNTRGIVQLVVLNIGVELKVLSSKIFAIFVLAATIMTFMTSPLIYLIYLRKRNDHSLEKELIKSSKKSNKNTSNYCFCCIKQNIIEKSDNFTSSYHSHSSNKYPTVQEQERKPLYNTSFSEQYPIRHNLEQEKNQVVRNNIQHVNNRVISYKNLPYNHRRLLHTHNNQNLHLNFPKRQLWPKQTNSINNKSLSSDYSISFSTIQS
ncbi:unnamed protein product [Didymodactylos carnosus]|uniref:Cation/H+ exchanger transmembrane domain-containing protein n=1 Tax=Didymodactylos carnosus TaxID=1234261 RepID=A0A813VGH8_9BILA|nr:unnamed protein product [Didymodactylos carnosus]CAF0853329.1 unnamed protein product [Didymodactylos carnosus]CAF3624585.1 unnamed protein product [Didymodactylos carnosus]CAF3638503.1 unnamed protein product [Didymodactylos carnosus]